MLPEAGCTECGVVDLWLCAGTNRVAGTPYQGNSRAHRLGQLPPLPRPPGASGLFILLAEGNLHFSSFAFFGPKQNHVEVP